MAYSIEGISRVRIRPLVLDMAEGQPAASPGAMEVTWKSTQTGRWHQVYVNGRLAGVTAEAEDRRLIVSAPAGRDGTRGLLLAEVIAVDAGDRWTDFGDELAGFTAERGARVRLTWQAGLYLDPRLESFNVFADGRTGEVDYETPLNEEPIPARPGGCEPWGYGCGGYGVGGYGAGAAVYEWTTEGLEPGEWRFAVVAIDKAGNRLALAAEVTVSVSPFPRPPSNFHVVGYDPLTAQATLGWDPSPDV